MKTTGLIYGKKNHPKRLENFPKIHAQVHSVLRSGIPIMGYNPILFEELTFNETSLTHVGN